MIDGWTGERGFRMDGLIENVGGPAHSSPGALCSHVERGWSEAVYGQRLPGQFVRCMGLRIAGAARCKKDKLGTTAGRPWVL